jgi:hypothetical protein
MANDPTFHFDEVNQDCSVDHDTGFLPVKNLITLPTATEILEYSKFEDNEKGNLLKCYKDLLVMGSIGKRSASSWLELRYLCNCLGKANCSFDINAPSLRQNGGERLWDYETGCNSEINKG